MQEHSPSASRAASPSIAASAPRSWRAVAAALLAGFPALDPIVSGPSPAVQPWLASMGCALALWLLAGPRLEGARLRLLAAGAALVAWAVLSQMALRPETVFLAAGLLLIVLATGVGSDAQVTQGAQVGLLVAACASAAIGLLQYFGFSDALVPFVSRTSPGEAYANLRQPNQYATMTWVGAAVLLWGRVRVRPALAFGLIMLLALGSAASASRTGMLQGCLLTVLAAVWNGPQRRRRLLLCGAAAVAYFAGVWLLPLALPMLAGAAPATTLWSKVGGAGDSCGSRLVLWRNVLHLISLKPVLGWGWGELDYAHFVTLYDGPRFCDILDNAHDLPLHLAVELGVPAALLVCAGGLWWIARQRPWREADPQRRLGWAILALILLHSLLEYPLWYGQFQLAFGIALGCLLADGAAPRAAAPRRGPALALGLVALAGTAYAAWDYMRVSQIYLPPEQRRPAWREDTMAHALRSWLFAGQARFADLTLTTVTRTNAQRVYPLALEALHYSPEPRVIRRAIEAATMLGRDEEAVLWLARYRAAFPQDYAGWGRGGPGARAED